MQWTNIYVEITLFPHHVSIDLTHARPNPNLTTLAQSKKLG